MKKKIYKKGRLWYAEKDCPVCIIPKDCQRKKNAETSRVSAEMWVDMQEKKTVDVIIPVNFPDEKFQMILDRLEKQTYSVGRIIVINTDENGFPSDLRCPANMEVYHIAPEEFDHGATRDMAARKSTADLLLFMTQDAVPADTHLVEHLVQAFEDPLVAAAYARQLARKTDSAIERFTRNFNYPAKSRVKTQADIPVLGIKTYFCSNSCAMYRKSIYEELGGFLPEAIFNEDMIFASTAINAGYSIAYVAEARVIHSHNYTGLQQFRRNFDNGVSHADNQEAFREVAAIGEGKRLVFDTMRYLIRHHEYGEMVRLVYLSGCKAVGFQLGKKYYKLPRKLVLLCTMNKKYWQE